VRLLLCCCLIAGLLALAEGPGQGQSEPAKPQAPGRAAPADSPAPDIVFTGEVDRGKPFDYDLGQDPGRGTGRKGDRGVARNAGRGLVFHLDPAPDVGSGWDIEIVKKGDLSDDRSDFVAVATPPYHFFNQRYLSTAYDYTAAAAVALSPRHFYFVGSDADYKIADREVNINVYPNHAISDEIDAADDEARKIQVGRGEFVILDSRITPATEKDSKGTIDWLKFEVRLTFHTGLNFRQVFVRSNGT
jgi:hypothetical protein